MAHVIKYSWCRVWDGPFADKAGEFCGNHFRKNLEVGADGTVQKTLVPGNFFEGDTTGFKWMDDDLSMRIGEPVCGGKLTREDLENQGIVGLYLKCDRKTLIGSGKIKPVDTDILQEEVILGRRPSTKPFNPGVRMRKDKKRFRV